MQEINRQKFEELKKPISVKNFTADSKDELLIIGGIQKAVKDAKGRYDGDISMHIKEILTPLGVNFGASALVISRGKFEVFMEVMEEPPVEFPDPIAKAWGHSGGGIDLYAEFNGKYIGIEDEPKGWYRACEPEILKLGWMDHLDYRICAWGTRQKATIERFKRLEMLPFPHKVVVVTRSEIMEIQNRS